MRCFVYKSQKKANTYLFLANKNDFSTVPSKLLSLFGAPQFTFEFELTEERKLVIASAKQVISGLQDQGYYLQIPPQNNFSA